MLHQILSLLGLAGEADSAAGESRRRHVRHGGVTAEVTLMGRRYALHDWSLGGVFFDTFLDALVKPGEKVQFTLSFRFPHETVSVTHQGRVVRAQKRGVAAEFAPMPVDVRRKFDRVLDNIHAQSFLESQVA